MHLIWELIVGAIIGAIAGALTSKGQEPWDGSQISLLVWSAPGSEKVY